jgi:hypothetical protein
MSCGNATAVWRLCRDKNEMHCSAGWIIELGTAPDIAPNGGFTMRSARSGEPS